MASENDLTEVIEYTKGPRDGSLPNIVYMRLSYILISVGILVLTEGCRQTEKTEAAVSEIEAAQIAGRNAAKSMMDIDWNDSTKRADAFAKIDSIARTYPDTVNGSAFRNTFRSTVRTLHPEIFKSAE